MGNIVLSKVGGEASLYIDLEKPSELIPFKGDFPIVPEYKREEFFETIRNKAYLEDCDEWIQTAVVRGKRIHDIENNFKEYLADNNIPIADFMKMSSADKSTELIRFFNANSLTLDNLKV